MSLQGRQTNRILDFGHIVREVLLEYEITNRKGVVVEKTNINPPKLRRGQTVVAVTIPILMRDNGMEICGTSCYWAVCTKRQERLIRSGYTPPGKKPYIIPAHLRLPDP